MDFKITWRAVWIFTIALFALSCLAEALHTKAPIWVMIAVIWYLKEDQKDREFKRAFKIGEPANKE